MNVKVVDEFGYAEALFGIGLSFGLTSGQKVSEFRQVKIYGGERKATYDRLERVAKSLAHKGNGESKFLESMTVYLDITAPRYWWSEFDTYRVGITKQSESTMHTATKRHLTEEDFEGGCVNSIYLDYLNKIVDTKNLISLKMALPESFLQRRIVVTNYKVLQNMYRQRKNHRLKEWHIFCDALLSQLEHNDFIENYETTETK